MGQFVGEKTGETVSKLLKNQDMKLIPSVLQAVSTGVSTALKELEGDRARDQISRLVERLTNRNENELR